MHSETTLAVEYGKINFNLKKHLYFTLKRIFDILVGFIGIMVMIPIAIVIKIVYLFNKDYDSIFFTQKRIGKNGKEFNFYKFRTMVPNADNILYQLLQSDEDFKKEYTLTKKSKSDPRVTKIGKILRKTSIDEFPQFINILLGQMSVVGNRPYLPREKVDMGNYYEDIIISKPGLTGLWQTNGRSNVTFNERLRLDQTYSLIRNIKLDIKIFIKTIIQVIKRDGAE